MSFNWEEIGKTVYGILGVGGYRPIQMWDADGTKTMDPADAIRFIATKKSNDPELSSFDVMLVIHDENASSHLDIQTPNLTDPTDFDATYSLKKNIQKNIGDKYGLSINWSKFSHNIKSKDADDSTAIQESKDISKVYGTTKSSFQRVGESRLIIRHTDSIDESKQGSRWRKIKGMFIETKLGERFNYAYPHVAGARAMARHLSNNGSFTDQVAESIKSMSSDYVDLKRANKTLKKSGMLEEAQHTRDALDTINKDVKRLAGPRGYAKMLESISSLQESETDPAVDNLAKQLAEACGCDTESDDYRPLTTAAKYIVNLKAPSATQDNTWLAARMLDLSTKIADPESAEKLSNMAKTLQSGEQISADQVNYALEQVKEMTTESIDESLKRLLELGGIYR